MSRLYIFGFIFISLSFFYSACSQDEGVKCGSKFCKLGKCIDTTCICNKGAFGYQCDSTIYEKYYGSYGSCAGSMSIFLPNPGSNGDDFGFILLTHYGCSLIGTGEFQINGSDTTFSAAVSCGMAPDSNGFFTFQGTLLQDSVSIISSAFVNRPNEPPFSASCNMTVPIP